MKNNIEDLVVFASGIFPVEISNGKRINSFKRVGLRASVNCETGEVSFHISKNDIKKLEK